MILLDVDHEILAIANQFLDKVKKSGPNNIMAHCPFHRKLDGSEERRPSFAMNTANGLYFCHSCEAKGNLYTFLRDLGINRNDITLRYGMVLEAAASNSPPRLNFLDPKITEQNPLPESLLGAFDLCPVSLLQAGFEQETLRHFDVGFDQWHNRITFPLRDFQGRLSGLSGRDVTGEALRYKVYDKEFESWGYPARLQPEKRRLLWNIHSIYPDFYFGDGDNKIIVVEGFKACIWVWQCGLTNVVALLGAYVSEEQRLLFERLGVTIYLFLDHNEAGIGGTIKAIQKLRRSCRVKVMEYPVRIRHNENAQAQPDSLTSDEIHHAFDGAVDYVTWLYRLNES